VAQAQPAAQPLCGEPQPRERLDRHEIGHDAAHVAHDDDGVGVAGADQRPQTLARRGHVGARQPREGHDDAILFGKRWRWQHGSSGSLHHKDRILRENSSAPESTPKGWVFLTS